MNNLIDAEELRRLQLSIVKVEPTKIEGKENEVFSLFFGAA